MQHKFLSSINEVTADAWNSLCEIDYPFLRHEFFAALENSGSTTLETGWQPHHLIIEDNKQMIAFMPLFLKQHSYGEYVFDWTWADAYYRYGHQYYPKLLNAIPFTPATGPRWCISGHADSDKTLNFLFECIEKEAAEINYSSCHWLFTDPKSNCLLEERLYLKRTGCQYHWLNKNYSSFEHFLSTFTSRKRKNLKKERQKVAEQGIQLIVKEGAEINDKDWQHFYLFYHLTYFKHNGRQGYLTESFFPELAQSLTQHLVMVQAIKNEQTIAAALYLKDKTTLYGRYWGCKEEHDYLHFETCYYQGIEYAIQHKLKRFDPGAQGEHKIQRGFTPVPTYSYHWIRDQEFASAINAFLHAETEQIHKHIECASGYLPFKLNKSVGS